MCKTKKIIAGVLCAIVAGIGIAAISLQANVASAQTQTAGSAGITATTTPTPTMSIAQLQQIIDLLKQQIQQIILLLQQRAYVQPVCGDGVCETAKGETAASCPKDCGAIIDGISTITIEGSGEGYQIGDIVKIKSIPPRRGDVIYYDSEINNSMCMAMGSGWSIAKVVGVSGDKVSFFANSARVGDTTITYDRDYYLNGRAVIGGVKYAKLAGGNITVPINEIFADSWIGFQCFPGEIEDGSSIPYNRFTVAQSAIIAILGEKVGHDDKLEKELKSIVY